jgi:hypothetical protein
VAGNPHRHISSTANFVLLHINIHTSTYTCNQGTQKRLWRHSTSGNATYRYAAHTYIGLIPKTYVKNMNTTLKMPSNIFMTYICVCVCVYVCIYVYIYMLYLQLYKCLQCPLGNFNYTDQKCIHFKLHIQKSKIYF